MLWTRLAPNPLADDGLGGMPSRPVNVGWEIAADNRFQRIERRGTGTALAESAHSLHVELTGLRPSRDYFYRFRAAGYQSPIGRTHTAPEPTALPPALTMCLRPARSTSTAGSAHTAASPRTGRISSCISATTSTSIPPGNTPPRAAMSATTSVR